LKWKYKGNSYLEAGGKVSLAIDAYNKALQCISRPNNNLPQQEGIILLLRASAFLQQAQSHKLILQQDLQEWSLPDSGTLQGLLLEPAALGMANSILQKLQMDGKRQQAKLRKIQYRHGLYQMSLLRAMQDSLRATALLPNYSTSWLRAGELLSQLWKLKESRQYYEKAMSLDESLSLEPILKDLQRRQELLDRAGATEEWPEDSLRLALDVAG
jgi:tetratricopeptide (TPR) repeat protein